MRELSFYVVGPPAHCPVDYRKPIRLAEQSRQDLQIDIELLDLCSN